MRTKFKQDAAVALVVFAALATAGCTVDAGQEDGDGAAAGASLVGEASQALTTSVCGDGIHADGELCFSTAVLAASTQPGEGIAAGHLNAGSALDFVTASGTTDQLGIRLGNGSGGFPSGFTYSVGDGPNDVAIADFNGDGLKDIITTGVLTNQVRVRWGGGSPSWGSFSDWGVGNSPKRVATGDMNSDGRDDFVTINAADSTLTVRRRTATGFDAAQTYAAGDFEGEVQLVDCDSDGDLDLLYTSGFEATAALWARRNNGAGSFGAATATNLGTGLGFSSALTVGDWNGDGIKDVVVLMTNDAMVRVLGTGGCNFGSKVSGSTLSTPVRIYNADMDKDGNLDLVVAHETEMKISIYLGHGNGNFSSPTVLSQGDLVSDLAIGDFNGDASPDIVFIGSGGTHLLGSNP